LKINVVSLCTVDSAITKEQSNQLAELLMKAYRYYEVKAISEQRSFWPGDEEA
jgi:hypothetical protein